MTITPPSAIRVLDVPVHPVTLGQVRDALEAWIDERTPRQVVTVNMDFLRIARREPRFHAALSQAALSVADGMPVCWLAGLTGSRMPGRITGVEVLEVGAQLVAERGGSVFLLGAAPGVAAAAGQQLVARYPGLRIAGAYAPPFGPFSATEDRYMVEQVRAARPDMLFVAFGAPRQDTWIADHLAELDVPVCVGIGGAFNFITGRVSRAPDWMQRAGLEWMYRLGCEPRRLWRRYLLGDLPVFVGAVAQALLPGTKSPVSTIDA